MPRTVFSDNSAHVVLCVLRELAINAVRHGKARHLWIAGAKDDTRIRFSIRDDGTGFDPDTRPNTESGHFGLQGVAERLARLDGSLQIDSAPGRGTKITITLHTSAQLK